MALWTAPIDDRDENKRSLETSFAGTFDGSDWHALLVSDGDFASGYKHGGKTLMTLNPTKFKTQIAAFQKAFNKVRTEREAFDTSADVQWEALLEARMKKAFTTSKEATIIGVLATVKDKNKLQQKCRSERNSGNSSKPNSYADVHPFIKKAVENAINLMPIE